MNLKQVPLNRLLVLGITRSSSLETLIEYNLYNIPPRFNLGTCNLKNKFESVTECFIFNR